MNLNENSKSIDSIAGRHLGKAGDGTVVNPYITPDSVQSDLLVGVPRHFNRTGYGIEESNLPFVGHDVWNGYEFSCLLDNGFPISGVVRLVYDAASPNIVESKSIKLYFNSFNMAKMGKTVAEAVKNVELLIVQDLKECLGVTPEVTLHLSTVLHDNQAPLNGEYEVLENIVDVANIKFTAYTETPDTLVIVDTPGEASIQSSSLRSNCRITNQPDWGDIFISYKGPKQVTPESLLQYIVSMRKENHFHEEICECVFKRLYDLLEPVDLTVACLYTRRGGVDINPIRSISAVNHPMTDSTVMVNKTDRQ